MKRFVFSLLGIISILISQAQNTDIRIVKSLNFGWRFFLGDEPNAAMPSFCDSAWRIVSLPHDFQIEQPWVEPSPDEKPDESNVAANIRSRLSARAFKEMGCGWYRLHFCPDDALQGKRLLLNFGGIMYVGDVFVNGQLAGRTDYGYVGFEIDVTNLLHFGTDNVISVRADTGQPNSSRWYTGGGLFRGVELIATNADFYFNRHPLRIVTRNNNEVLATFECTSAQHTNSVNVEVQLSDPNGNVVYQQQHQLKRIGLARTQEVALPAISVPNAEVWDVEHPRLYTLTIALIGSAGEKVDEVSEQFGFRTIEISPEFGLKLNGQKVVLKGIANHHTLGALGAAAYPRAIEKRLQMLKSFGINHIRTSHNPYSREFITLCDKYGILVVDELYDKWTREHTGGRTSWESHWQYDLPEWVKCDRNSPSVVMWSLGNELQQEPNQPFNDYGVTAYKLQRTLLHRYDTTRLTTVAMHPRFRNWQTDTLPCNLALITDVQAYNYRYMYFEPDGKKFPYMTFYQSEASVAAMGPNYFEMDLSKVIGLAYWGAIDYLGESQGWPAKGWTQGVFDISLEPKPQAYFLKSIFSTEPVAHIAIAGKQTSAMWNGVQTGITNLTDHWNYSDGDTLNIVVFTNADEAELFLNGKSLGKKNNNISNTKQRNKIEWQRVAYKPGKVHVVARTNGRVVAQYAITTSGAPRKLRLTPDNNHWVADGQDLQHIRVEATDAHGVRCPMAQHEVKFEIVSGDAEIVAVSSGDQYSDELNVCNHRKLYNGSALLILRAGQKASEIVVKATADGLQSAQLRVETM